MPEPGISIGQARRRAAARLAPHSETAELDSELLVRAVLGLDRAGLFLKEPELIDAAALDRLDALVERRMAGEPIAYILHRAPFRRIELYVDERVLVPRPETEELVQLALDWLERHGDARRVVDVGTGSGAIALSLASELPESGGVKIVATDVSSGALHVASINRERLGLTGRVRLVRTHLLDGIDGTFDLVLANLPYLRPDQRHPSTTHEPDLALYAGDDGFDLYRELIAALPDRLRAQGAFMAEIDPAQADQGLRYAEWSTSLPGRIQRDVFGRDRFLMLGDL